MNKLCTKCNNLKSVNLFPIQKRSSHSNEIISYGSHCKACKNKRSREHWQEISHLEQTKSKRKLYRQNNLQKCRESTNHWYQNNKQHVNKRNQKLLKDHPELKLKKNLRRVMNNFFKKNRRRTFDIFGCSQEFFIQWMNYLLQFTQFTMEDYGTKWCIDHVIPCHSFNLLEAEQQHVCFNWSNLRPCELIENISKSDKIDQDLIQIQKERKSKFIESIDVANYNERNLTTTSL